MELVCVTNARNHRYYAEDLGLPCHRAPVGGSNRPLRALYQQAVLSSTARRLGGDVLFCPGYLSPVAARLPTVVVMHDVNFRDIPQSVSASRRLLYNLIVPRAVRAAAAVITVSHFAKQRLRRALACDDGAIAVVHEGPPAHPQAPGADWAAVRRRYGIRGACFLSISSGAPHKNVPRLVQGFVQARRSSADGAQLALVGHELDAETRAYLEREGMRGAVAATGFVPQADKLAFLRNSRAFVFPSLYEGFGLPALEAQGCGLPLAASRCGSLPEVCGRGALYFDARSAPSIAGAFLQLDADAALRARLIRAGYANLSRFSWTRAAEETLVVLRKAAARRPAAPQDR